MELAVKLAFITGFPERVSMELKQVKDCETVSMSELITRARVLVSVGVRKWLQSPPEGHMMRLGNRPLLVIQTMVKGKPEGLIGRWPSIICYRCGKESHKGSRCDQGNGRGGAAASEAIPLVA